MRWKLPSGRMVFKNDAKYKIDFDKKSKSNGQFAVKQFLKEFCTNHILFEEYTLPSTRLRVDFIDATRKLAIEFDGPQHSEYNKFFHNNSRLNFLQSIKNDMQKREFLENNGYLVIQVFKEDLPLTKKWFKEKYDIDL